jgi:hypothetical protein
LPQAKWVFTKIEMNKTLFIAGLPQAKWVFTKIEMNKTLFCLPAASF